MGWLVLDVGSGDPRLIGAFGLHSSPYSLAARDAYLAWVGPSGLLRKTHGLLCIMDMPLCTALPPYSTFLGGKLIAALALTDEVSAAFVQRYSSNLPSDGSLLAISTLCATGIHCPVFNRIMLRSGGLYRRIGVTAGYSTAFVSDRTLAAAREIVVSRGAAPRRPLFAKSMRITKRALEYCGLPGQRLLRLGVRKGVYLGVSDARAIEMLRTGQYNVISRPNTRDVTDYWVSRVDQRLQERTLRS